MSDVKSADLLLPTMRKIAARSILEELASVQPINLTCRQAASIFVAVDEETVSMKNRRICRKAIVDHLKNDGGHIGSIECPICKGKLAYSYTTYNGHIHGKCDGGCVWWME